MALLANTALADVCDTEPARPTISTSSPLGSAVALETAARARSAPLGRSKWPLEPARRRRGARNGRSSPLGSAGALDMAARAGSVRLGLASKTPHLPTFATSSPLGSAGALEMAARARSAPLGRSKRPLEPARLHWGAQNGRSSSLGSARALEIARPGCSKTLHLPTSPKSSPLGSAGSPDIAARARSAPLGRRRFTGQDHECLLRSTERRTFSCMECTGTH